MNILHLIWIIPLSSSFGLLLCSLLVAGKTKDTFTMPKEFILDIMKVEDNKRIRIIQHCEVVEGEE